MSVTTLTIAAILVSTTSCSGAPGPITVNGRTLLTYAAGTARGAAAQSGVLGTNAAGCISIGDFVLIVPNGSELKPDGSIVVDGTTYTLGSDIQVGGGVGAAPGKNPCGKHLQYWYI